MRFSSILRAHLSAASGLKFGIFQGKQKQHTGLCTNVGPLFPPVPAHSLPKNNGYAGDTAIIRRATRNDKLKAMENKPPHTAKERINRRQQTYGAYSIAPVSRLQSRRAEVRRETTPPHISAGTLPVLASLRFCLSSIDVEQTKRCTPPRHHQREHAHPPPAFLSHPTVSPLRSRPTNLR